MSAPEWEIDATQSTVTVKAKTTFHGSRSVGPLSGRVIGDPSALEDSAGGTVAIAIDKFDFGNALQNAAVRSKLDTSRFPTAHFVVEKARVVSRSPWRVVIVGQLDYRDRKTRFEVEASGDVGEQEIRANATFPMNLPAIGVKPPSFLFLKVSDDVMVEVALVARRVPG